MLELAASSLTRARRLRAPLCTPDNIDDALLLVLAFEADGAAKVL